MRAVPLLLKGKSRVANEHLHTCLWDQSCEAPGMLKVNDSQTL